MNFLPYVIDSYTQFNRVGTLGFRNIGGNLEIVPVVLEKMSIIMAINGHVRLQKNNTCRSLRNDAARGSVSSSKHSNKTEIYFYRTFSFPL